MPMAAVKGQTKRMEDIKQYDIARSDELEMFGIKIIRFKNEEVFNNLKDVLKNIIQELNHLNT